MAVADRHGTGRDLGAWFNRVKHYKMALNYAERVIQADFSGEPPSYMSEDLWIRLARAHPREKREMEERLALIRQVWEDAEELADDHPLTLFELYGGNPNDQGEGSPDRIIIRLTELAVQKIQAKTGRVWVGD